MTVWVYSRTPNRGLRWCQVDQLRLIRWPSDPVIIRSNVPPNLWVAPVRAARGRTTPDDQQEGSHRNCRDPRHGWWNNRWNELTFEIVMHGWTCVMTPVVHCTPSDPGEWWTGSNSQTAPTTEYPEVASCLDGGTSARWNDAMSKRARAPICPTVNKHSTNSI